MYHNCSKNSKGYQNLESNPLPRHCICLEYYYLRCFHTFTLTIRAFRGRHKRRPHNTARKNFDEVNIERKCFCSFLILCMKEIRRPVFIIQIIHFFTLLCTCQQRSKNFSPCALVLSSVSKTVYKFRGFYNAVATDLSSKPPS